MLSTYFLFQLKMMNRKMGERGLPSILSYFLTGVAYLSIAVFLFVKTKFASYVILLFGIHQFLYLSKPERIEFLSITYGTLNKNKIRLIENAFICIPIIILLGYFEQYLEIYLLLIFSILTAVISFNRTIQFSIPTPFSKRPNEFTFGFRKTILFYIIAYCLAIVALNVDNFNLGLFSSFLVFLIAATYYVKPENEFFVWIYADRPNAFLLKKIRSAALNVTILALPILLTLFFYDPSEVLKIFIFYLIGLLLISLVILVKYAAYPLEISTPEVLMITFGLYLTPLLLAIFPYFYKKSIHNLSDLLNDKR